MVEKWSGMQAIRLWLRCPVSNWRLDHQHLHLQALETDSLLHALHRHQERQEAALSFSVAHMVAVQASALGTHLVARVVGKLRCRAFTACTAQHSRQAAATLAPPPAWRIPPRCRAFSPATRCDDCSAPALCVETILPASILSCLVSPLRRLGSQVLHAGGAVRLRAWDSRAEGLVRACGSATASARAHTSAAASAHASAHASAPPARDARRAVSRAGSNPEAAGSEKGWPQAVLGMLVAAGLVLALAVAPPQASARQLAAVEAAPATLEMKACLAQHRTTSWTGACMCAARAHTCWQ